MVKKCIDKNCKFYGLETSCSWCEIYLDIKKDRNMGFKYSLDFEVQDIWYFIPTIALEFNHPGEWIFGGAFLCFAGGLKRERIY